MKKLNKKGSILVSVVVVVMLIFIVLAIVLAIASSSHKRSINEHARKQAYLSGLSVAQAIAGQIGEGPNPEEYLPKKDTPVEMTINKFPDGTTGGSACIIITYSKESTNILYIQVTSTYNRMVEKVQLTMQLFEEHWYLKTYSKIGDEFSEKNE